MIIVDVANVMGSRPDGWWRDRAGAAARLHRSVLAAVSDGALEAGVVLVLEGAARAGVPADLDERLPDVRHLDERHPDVEVIHAAGSGDDAIVACVEHAVGRQRRASDTGGTVTVVTADRELRARVRAAGGTPVGPRWLLDRLQ